MCSSGRTRRACDKSTLKSREEGDSKSAQEKENSEREQQKTHDTVASCLFPFATNG